MVFTAAASPPIPALLRRNISPKVTGYTTIASTTGGANYAQGGARVSSPSASTPAGFAQRPVSTQLTEYLGSTGGLASNNSVYVIQGGSNDLFQNLAMVQAGAMTQAELQQSIISTGSSFAQQVATLQGAGAKYIVVPNVPNLGLAPAFAGALSSTGAAVSAGYNTVVQKAAKRLWCKCHCDRHLWFNQRSGGQSQPCTVSPMPPRLHATSTSLVCSPATLVSPNAANTYVFADGVHPTTGAQKLGSQYMLSVINAHK